MQKFKRMKAFVAFKMKIWFIDLAFVDKLEKESIVSKFLLVRQNLIGWLVDVKTNEEKTFQGNCKSIFNQDCKKIVPIKVRLKRDRVCKKVLKALWSWSKKSWSAMSETKVSLAERVKRSLKKFFNVTLKTMDLSTLTSYRILSYFPIPENIIWFI